MGVFDKQELTSNLAAGANADGKYLPSQTDKKLRLYHCWIPSSADWVWAATLVAFEDKLDALT
jgi:hypothetical protein